VTTYVLGAGASCHAGYPLASNLGLDLEDWTLGSNAAKDRYQSRLSQLKDLYGSLFDFELFKTRRSGLGLKTQHTD
jgi:hypothetical protein